MGEHNDGSASPKCDFDPFQITRPDFVTFVTVQ